MSDARHLGDWGEEEAARYLQGRGIRIVGRHFQTRWGEVDLIGRDKETWVFVEVKTRTRAGQPSAADAITFEKQKKLTKAALSYIKMKRLEGENFRFDVVLIESGGVEWIPDAFEPLAFYTL